MTHFLSLDSIAAAYFFLGAVAFLIYVLRSLSGR
jgi:hypothetical protein